MIILGYYIDESVVCLILLISFFFQAEDGIRVLVRSRGLGDVYKRQAAVPPNRQSIPSSPPTRAEFRQASGVSETTSR